jgi:ketosteroid isomerase-like protein
LRRINQGDGMAEHPHTELLRDFYLAFHERRADSMARCYHTDVMFSDPAFPSLKGGEVMDMWRMLLSRASADFAIELVDAQADSDGGSADWIARYTFSKTGRPVANHIHSRFAFREGLIVRQHDTFDFWKWSRMALGPMGMALGWSPLLKAMVRKQARLGLEKFRTPA